MHCTPGQGILWDAHWESHLQTPPSLRASFHIPIPSRVKKASQEFQPTLTYLVKDDLYEQILSKASKMAAWPILTDML